MDCDTHKDAWERLEGARIDYTERLDDGRIVLVFSHRGTDDDSGFLTVAEDAIRFNDGGPDVWEELNALS